jgi:hypothetical protein
MTAILLLAPARSIKISLDRWVQYRARKQAVARDQPHAHARGAVIDKPLAHARGAVKNLLLTRAARLIGENQIEVFTEL